MLIQRLPILSLGVLLCLSPRASADLVMSNTNTNGRQVLTRDISPQVWSATPFTTDGSDYILNSILAEIEDFNEAGTLFLEVWSVDNVFASPDISLGRLSLIDDQLVQKTFSGSIPLSANTSYFLVAGVDNGGGQWRERINYSDPLGPYFDVDLGTWTLETLFNASSIQQSYSSSNLGGTWQSDALLGAPLRMQMEASVVPEPVTISLVALGGLCYWVAGRARRSTEPPDA